MERVLARALGPQDADTLMNAGRTMPLQRATDLALAVASGTAPGDADRPSQVPLTPRERQVAALVASGRTNRQIGAELFISPCTAGVHVSHILAKLGLASRGEAAAAAHNLGLTKPAAPDAVISAHTARQSPSPATSGPPGRTPPGRYL